ncbi:hypothetical protein GGF31_007382 [Allomyces arbusculus]|nr:hypothetical protein GGF31_007382 [Allomyces arbusculus]
MDYRNNSSYPYKPAFAQQQPQTYPAQPAYQQPQPVVYPSQPVYAQQQPPAYSQQPAGPYAAQDYVAPVAVAAPGYGVPAPAPVVPVVAAPIVADDPSAVMALYPTGNEEPAEPTAAAEGDAEGEAEAEPATPPELANPVVETIESVMVDIVEARELPDKSDAFSSIDPFVVVLAGTHTRFETPCLSNTGPDAVFNHQVTVALLPKDAEPDVAPADEIVLEVWEANSVLANTLIGRARVQVEQLVGAAIDRWFDLVNEEGEAAGQLRVVLTPRMKTE